MDVAVAAEVNALRAGVVAARSVSASARSQALEGMLAELLARRSAPLSPEEESRRMMARDLLRFGRYKPTGRGKPASEYLIRAAGRGEFPRINALVDVCNAISLKHVLPISLWDLERASSILVRRGREGESYVFNTAGQEIELQDLLLGARQPDDVPVINPVKDSMPTKTSSATAQVAAIVYASPAVLGDLPAICAEFCELLASCGDDVEADWAIVGPGEQASLLV